MITKLLIAGALGQVSASAQAGPTPPQVVERYVTIAPVDRVESFGATKTVVRRVVEEVPASVPETRRGWVFEPPSIKIQLPRFGRTERPIRAQQITREWVQVAAPEPQPSAFGPAPTPQRQAFGPTPEPPSKAAAGKGLPAPSARGGSGDEALERRLRQIEEQIDFNSGTNLSIQQKLDQILKNQSSNSGAAPRIPGPPEAPAPGPKPSGWRRSEAEEEAAGG